MISNITGAVLTSHSFMLVNSRVKKRQYLKPILCDFYAEESIISLKET